MLKRMSLTSTQPQLMPNTSRHCSTDIITMNSCNRIKPRAPSLHGLPISNDVRRSHVEGLCFFHFPSPGNLILLDLSFPRFAA